ncbi:MAG: aryl-sulfate sulfotransferase [Planctomycetes bacterium]|nr:aryl-sulfate sulfotransferase [Planctomycetota bacterium]
MSTLDRAGVLTQPSLGTSLVVALAASFAHAQTGDSKPAPAAPRAPSDRPAPQEGDALSARGLKRNEPGALQGYTLLSPLQSRSTYLVDMQGQVVHEWKTQSGPGQSDYLLANGHLLRTARVEGETRFRGGGIGGRVQEWDWDGKLVWDYKISDERRHQHHDIEPLPNGNVLMIVWEAKTKEEALARGRDEKQLGEDGFWPDAILEVQPVLPDSGKIVWEWHAWDHLVQDRDPKKANYGNVAEHPELLDINADHRFDVPLTEEQKRVKEERERQMRASGYVGGGEDDEDAPRDRRRGGDAPKDGGTPSGGAKDAGSTGGARTEGAMPEGAKPDGTKPEGTKPEGTKPEGTKPEGTPAGGERATPRDGQGGGGRRARGGGPGGGADWMHTNAVDYDAMHDLIVISSHNTNELYVIDHGTTTAEAASHAGGKRGKGGDFLYRWGNPRAYGAGTAKDQQLFAQHDTRFIADGLPGAGHVMVFDNGQGRPDGEYSRVVELELPFDAAKGFTKGKGAAFGPKAPVWSYQDPERFFSHFISGADRLANGNTLICEGASGRVFEVTADKKIVWEFLNPLGGDLPMGGPGGGPGGGRFGPGRGRGPGSPGGDGSDGPPRRRERDGAPNGPDDGAPRDSGAPNDGPQGGERRGPPPGDGPDGRGDGPDGRDGNGPRGRGLPGGPPPFGGPGGGPGGRGGPQPYSLFRATRIPLDHPAVKGRFAPSTPTAK